MTINIQNSVRTFLFLTLCSIAFNSQAQDWKSDKKVNVVFGLTQPLLVNGFNIEGNYIHNRLIFNYSHGVSLDFSESSVTPDLKSQGLAVHMPWTTGFGVGYRIQEWINVRVEPKWHRFEFYYDGENQSEPNLITAFNTMSLGVGIYGHYQPFTKKDNILKGFMIAPSVRFWPTINSSLSGNKLSYQNKMTNKTEEIKTLDPGIGFTPFIFNISIGYSFE